MFTETIKAGPHHFKEEIVHQFWVSDAQAIELMRNGEHTVKIAHRKRTVVHGSEPAFFLSALTGRAMPVSTAIVAYVYVFTSGV